jgi:flagellin
MTRINTNIPSLMGAMYLSRNMEALNLALNRMATGTRINSAKDDPQGIITCDVLRGELTGIESAVSNAERANNLLATAEGSMASINDMLLQVEAIIYEVASEGSMTSEELDARQTQIDNLVLAIDQVAGSATFAGQKLLDGTLSYRTQNVDPSIITDVAIHKAPVGTTSGAITLSIAQTAEAQRGELTFPNAATTGPVTVRFSGPEGTAVLSVPSGATSSQIVALFQGISEETGLTAELVDEMDPSQGVVFRTIDYGSASTIHTEIVSGAAADFALENAGGIVTAVDSGADIELTINGSHVVGQGLTAHYSSASIDMELHFDETWNAAGPPQNTSFKITSGGALFQLGPQIGADQQDSIGIRSMYSSSLGLSSLGYLSDLRTGGTCSLRNGTPQEMLAIMREAADQVTAERARIGSFQNNTLSVAINSLKQSQENISSARSSIMDANYAEETARVTRQQILLEATRSAMALAQSVPQKVLSLLMEA